MDGEMTSPSPSEQAPAAVPAPAASMEVQDPLSDLMSANNANNGSNHAGNNVNAMSANHPQEHQVVLNDVDVDGNGNGNGHQQQQQQHPSQVQAAAPGHPVYPPRRGSASDPSLLASLIPGGAMTMLPHAPAPMHQLSSSLPTHLTTGQDQQQQHQHQQQQRSSASPIYQQQQPRQVMQMQVPGSQSHVSQGQGQGQVRSQQQQGLGQGQSSLGHQPSRGPGHQVVAHPHQAQAQAQCHQRQRGSSSLRPTHLSSDAIVCVACGFAGSDVRIKCSNNNNGKTGCCYHARCIDLLSIVNSSSSHGGYARARGDNLFVEKCPHCRGRAEGLEIVPLSFGEMDRAQRVSLQKKGLLSGNGNNNNGGGGGGNSSSNNNIGGMGGGGANNSGGGSNNVNMNMNESASNDTSKKRSSSDLEAAASAPGSSYPSNIASACRIASSNNNGLDHSANALHHASSSSGNSSSATASSTSAYAQCYDPTVPRTGRWTDEELAFRDAIIAYFLEGSLPLSNGSKLNDFLSNMLKSKQSRLTKKMKHAKLSTKYFRIKSGFLSPVQKAKEFSSLEYNFVNVIADQIERSEIQFHMQREWRDHLAERCTYLRILFDADEWLRSVDTMDRRVALEKNRSRMVKRRCLMGKAMEKDVSESVSGVFIDVGAGDTNGKEDFLYDVEAKQARQMAHHAAIGGGGGARGAAGSNEEEDGEFGRFLMSMLDEAPINNANSAIAPGGGGSVPKKEKAVRSSYCDPNFRYAAPFLAGITSYIERNGVPFEHVDVWVPSTIPPGLENEGQSAPRVGSMGSGSNGNLAGMGGGSSIGVGKESCRLCFGGSATLGVQIVDEPTGNDDSSSSRGNDGGKKNGVTKRIAPLTGDEIFNFSLYGDYSEKFSFSSGCGLPGRVFHSGIAAWEQFLSNAPPEMFERRGGAIQFGIKTALGLPIESPNVGRIVVVLYSKHNRDKDEELVNRMVKDVRLFNPCPRWKLVVDVRSTSGAVGQASPVIAHPPPPNTAMTNSSSFSAGMSALSMQMQPNGGAGQQHAVGMDVGEQTVNNAAGNSTKEAQIMNLISILQENMPSDHNSPLGKQLNSIMSLRLILLRGTGRSLEEEQLVDTVLVLYESYTAAGRSRQDIALLVTRDFEFHMGHQAGITTTVNQPPLPHQVPSFQQQQPIHPIHEGVVPMETNMLIPHGQQQHLGAAPVLHNPNSFSLPSPLGGRPGSFIPPPAPPGVAPGLSPGMPGIGMPMPQPSYVGLQNVVHPYQPMQGMQQPMDISQPQQSPATLGSPQQLLTGQMPKSPTGEQI